MVFDLQQYVRRRRWNVHAPDSSIHSGVGVSVAIISIQCSFYVSFASSGLTLDAWESRRAAWSPRYKIFDIWNPKPSPSSKSGEEGLHAGVFADGLLITEPNIIYLPCSKDRSEWFWANWNGRCNKENTTISCHPCPHGINSDLTIITAFLFAHVKCNRTIFYMFCFLHVRRHTTAQHNAFCTWWQQIINPFITTPPSHIHVWHVGVGFFFCVNTRSPILH